jgi:hypothetical protein
MPPTGTGTPSGGMKYLWEEEKEAFPEEPDDEGNTIVGTDADDDAEAEEAEEEEEGGSPAVNPDTT